MKIHHIIRNISFIFSSRTQLALIIISLWPVTKTSEVVIEVCIAVLILVSILADSHISVIFFFSVLFYPTVKAVTY